MSGAVQGPQPVAHASSRAQSATSSKYPVETVDLIGPTANAQSVTATAGCLDFARLAKQQRW